MTSHHASPGFAIWLTGLPSSGKSSLAEVLSNCLQEERIQVQVLDSDDLRKWLTPDPTYTEEEREWFYQTFIRIAVLLTQNGVNVLIAATGSRRKFREEMKRRILHSVIVYVDCPPKICRERDSKGLWEKADQGEIENFPGVDAPYEEPKKPGVQVNTGRLNKEEAAAFVMESLMRSGFFNHWTGVTKRHRVSNM